MRWFYWNLPARLTLSKLENQLFSRDFRLSLAKRPQTPLVKTLPVAIKPTTGQRVMWSELCMPCECNWHFRILLLLVSPSQRRELTKFDVLFRTRWIFKFISEHSIPTSQSVIFTKLIMQIFSATSNYNRALVYFAFHCRARGDTLRKGSLKFNLLHAQMCDYVMKKKAGKFCWEYNMFSKGTNTSCKPKRPIERELLKDPSW